MHSRSDATTITRLPVLDRIQPAVNRVPIALAGSRRRWCGKPFEHMEIVEDGRVFLCCPGWQPSSIGNVFATPAIDIWRGPAAEAIRHSILADTFRWCEACPMLAAVTGHVHYVDKVPSVDTARIDVLNLAYDRTCNLACPSCRTEDVVYNSGARYAHLQRLTERVLPLFSYVDLLNITGSGDPFSSRTYRDLIRALDPAAYPQMRLRLHTNALLFTPAAWEALGEARRMVTAVWISIDAATEGTYRLNRGGDWAKLQQNLAFVSRLIFDSSLHAAETKLFYVVQANNWREMPAFVELARAHGARVQFHALRSWTTFSDAEHNARAVHLPEHPEHAEFVQLLRTLDTRHDVDLGELEALR